MAYLLDANVFIQAKNLHYAFDFCPAFWDWLEINARNGNVLSIYEVRDELLGWQDELSDWARDQGESFFRRQDASVAASFGLVASWVQGHSEYTASAKYTFLQAADFALVAYAHAYGHEVVTHERPENSKKRVKIPNVCLA